MQRMTRIAVTITAVLVSVSACHRTTDSGASSREPGIELSAGAAPPDSRSVDVVGMPAEDLYLLSRSELTREQWTSLLRVVVSGNEGGTADRPPVLGRYSVSDNRLRFTPQFPFDPGQRYDVELDPSRLPASAVRSPAPWHSHVIAKSIEIPALPSHPTTHVIEVFPSGSEVPENQLRLYLSFSAPMSRSGGARYIRLLDHTGRAVVDPFLPLDVALWNEDQTRYTVLFEPGRVKRGIVPNEEMGRPLVAGRTYTLVVDQGWLDAQGQPLEAPFRRQFRVGPAQEEAIDPASWRLNAPVEATEDPLAVTFPRPLDYALLQRALSVSSPSGERVTGDVRIEGAETRWIFVPRAPWQPGTYRLLAASILEDVAGNRIGRPFEVENVAQGEVKGEARPAALAFRVLPRRH